MTLKITIAAIAAFIASDANAETYVRAGHLVDVEAGRVLDDRMIRIENDRIVEVAPWRAPPAEARVIDWSNKTVLPGLIDMHTHLIGDIQGAGLADPLTYTAAQDALIGAGNARATLRAGFTSVRDVGVWRAFTDVALRDAINDGLIDGPRMA
ncbi:MAG: amidohydrolase family protein, partial [Parvularculaceae bacterium]